MIDFVLATNTPSAVKDFLEARGITTTNDDGDIVGVKGGFEFTANTIPNPLVTGGSGTEQDPWVYSTMKLYLVRISDGEEDDEIAGQDDARRTSTSPNLFSG